MNSRDQERLPLDAKLLSETVIELNISRRNVGLYPPEHAIIRGSIERAFGLLERLFELREAVTLGVAKDTLIIDEYTLDRKNPVFREFASSLHRMGIAAVTFSRGLAREDLLGFHKLIAAKEAPDGGSIADRAALAGIRHIRLEPIDFSSFKFFEGALRPGASGEAIWEDYIFGLLEGKLADAEGASVLMEAPPERVADILNEAMSPAAGHETYDRIITAYLRKKEKPGLGRESLEKFLTFLENLSPALKRQFLSRAFTSRAEEQDVEGLLADMTSGDFQRVAEFFTRHSSMIPETLRNVVDRLAAIRNDRKFGFDVLLGRKAVVDDIELDENIMRLFEEDHFKSFVSDEYQAQLSAMLGVRAGAERAEDGELAQELGGESVDRATAEVLVELMGAEGTAEEFRQNLASRLADLANGFAETGRIREALEIYKAMSSGEARGGAGDAAAQFFHSRQFVHRAVESLKLWGRQDREAALELARALKPDVIQPLLEALSEEKSAGTRKFLLHLLAGLGQEVMDEALRLLDGPWYVQRNVLYLMRASGDGRHADHARRLADHENEKVRLEAVHTLLHLGAPDAASHLLRVLLEGSEEAREWAIRQAGNYRVAEAVPHLLRLLEKKDVLGTGSQAKVPVVAALGRIGDARAIEPLLRICNARTLLHRGFLDELKTEVFRHLENYPPEAVRPLLELGLKSRNEEIRASSRRLLAGGGDHA
ncbi:MAG: hypothetical protein Kow0025_03480 [Thermodesulfovibrionales bacterium]